MFPSNIYIMWVIHETKRNTSFFYVNTKRKYIWWNKLLEIYGPFVIKALNHVVLKKKTRFVGYYNYNLSTASRCRDIIIGSFTPFKVTGNAIELLVETFSYLRARFFIACLALLTIYYVGLATTIKKLSKNVEKFN